MKDYSIRQVRQLLDKGKICTLELTRSFLERADSLNVNITLAKTEAEQDAIQAQAMIDSGNQKPLTGIPIVIADNISTKGILTTCGSKMLYNYKPVFDATVIEKLKAEGAIILGKTNVTEFGLGNDISPNGAVTAVSAGLALCAISANIGGSSIHSASANGTTSINATYGAVSRYGVIGSAPSLTQINVTAKDAQDCAIVLSAISGKDSRDMTSVGIKSDFNNIQDFSLQGKTIGVITEYMEQLSLDGKTSLANAIAIFKELGCNVKQVSLSSAKYAFSAYYIISSAEASSSLALYDGIRFGYRSKKGDTFEENIKHTRGEGFGEEVKRRLLLGAFVLSSGNYDKYYHKAKLVKEKLKAEFKSAFNDCDFLISPTEIDLEHSDRSQESIQNLTKSVPAIATSLVGLPWTTTTCGYNKQGMPIGVQLTTSHFADNALLACTSAFEQAFSAKRKEVQV